MNKKILDQLDDWQNDVEDLNTRKYYLERELTIVDLELIKKISQYDELCRKLIK